MKIKATEIDSTNIAGVEYDSKTKILNIRFKNSVHYQYDGVPLPVVTDMLANESKSIGKYFNGFVKGRYGDVRVMGPDND